VAGAARGDGRLKVSPRARGIAENQNLDLARAAATGPGGRVIERDILELSRKGAAKTAAQPGPAAAMAAQSGPAETAYEDVPLTNVRLLIAKSMHDSLQSMAQLTHNSSFDAADILAYRKKLKENAEALGLANITLNDIVLYAVSRVLKNHPELNAHFLDDRIRLFDGVNLGIAIDAPRGLLVPTLFGADRMSLNEIAVESEKLAEAAREGSISPDYLSGGTFTISNLGALGIEHFTPVINPPQTGILGVNNIQTKLRMANGEPAAYQAMGLSLTYDHRALDGAPASRFLRELCKSLESFSLLMAR
jgi:pyruvate dehydrogenase E2 component (dihydrolipoamide acetyltransferase)